MMLINPRSVPTYAKDCRADSARHPGGRFLVWDIILPPRSVPAKEVAAFLFRFKLPREEVETGYGTRWHEEGFPMERYPDMANEAGFKVVRQKKEVRTFFLDLRRRFGSALGRVEIPTSAVWPGEAIDG